MDDLTMLEPRMQPYNFADRYLGEDTMSCFRIPTPTVMATVALAMVLSADLAAAAAQDPLAGLRNCVRETEAARRLACFDNEMARVAPASAAPEASAVALAPAALPTSAAPPAPAAPAQTPEDKFGYRGVVARKDVDRRSAETGAVGQLTSTVTNISTLPHGEMIITLANGQVWGQLAPEPFFRLKVNDQVTIKPGALSSFTLSGPSKRSTKVTRRQ
jgi:hypothetical protein